MKISANDAPESSFSVLSCAGAGPIRFASQCWSCVVVSFCYFNEDSAGLGTYNRRINSATATVSVPGGGQYRLLYRLSNGAGPPNYWEARIESIDNSFTSIELEKLTDSASFNWRGRELPFRLPEGTAAIRLAFDFQQVRWNPQIDTDTI